MQTKEQLLEVVKAQRCSEIETYFNNLVYSGITAKFGKDRTEDVRIAGGKETLFSLKAFYGYYMRKNMTMVRIRDSYSKKAFTDTIENMLAVINELEDWGMESYIRNMDKQDYIKGVCTTTAQVMDVTWESTEIDAVPEPPIE